MFGKFDLENRKHTSGLHYIIKKNRNCDLLHMKKSKKLEIFKKNYDLDEFFWIFTAFKDSKARNNEDDRKLSKIILSTSNASIIFSQTDNPNPLNIPQKKG